MDTSGGELDVVESKDGSDRAKDDTRPAAQETRRDDARRKQDLDEEDRLRALRLIARLEAGELLRARQNALGPSTEQLMREFAANAAARAAGVREQSMDAGPEDQRYRNTQPNAGRQPPPQLTLQTLAKALVNKVENPTDGNDAVVRYQGRPAPSPGGFSILEAIHTVAIDPELAETIAEVVSPSVDSGGLVAFSVFGLRELAFLISPSANNMRIIDIGTGRSIRINYRQRPRDLSSQEIPPPRGGVKRVEKVYGPGGQSLTVTQFLVTIKRWVDDYVMNPFTLLTGGLFVFFWLVWRLVNREEA